MLWKNIIYKISMIKASSVHNFITAEQSQLETGTLIFMAGLMAKQKLPSKLKITCIATGTISAGVILASQGTTNFTITETLLAW